MRATVLKMSLPSLGVQVAGSVETISACEICEADLTVWALRANARERIRISVFIDVLLNKMGTT
jgi:hypothetical protein